MTDIQTGDQQFKEFLFNLEEDDFFYLTLDHFLDEYLVMRMMEFTQEYERYKKYISIKTKAEIAIIDNSTMEKFMAKLSELEVKLMFNAVFSREQIIDEFIETTDEDARLDILESHQHSHQKNEPLTAVQKAEEYLKNMPLLTYQQASEQQKKNNPEAFPKSNDKTSND